MNHRSRKTIAHFTLAAFVLAAVLLEIAHHDHHSIKFHTTPAVTSHECGPKEIHLSLDARRDCLACTQTTLRVSTAALTVPASSVELVWLGHLPMQTELTLHADVLHSGKRGPPPCSL